MSGFFSGLDTLDSAWVFFGSAPRGASFFSFSSDACTYKQLDYKPGLTNVINACILMNLERKNFADS